MPRAERSQLASTGRQARTMRQRMIRFQADLDRLPQHCTREDLAVLFYEVYRRGYGAGRSTAVHQRKAQERA